MKKLFIRFNLTAIQYPFKRKQMYSKLVCINLTHNINILHIIKCILYTNRKAIAALKISLVLNRTRKIELLCILYRYIAGANIYL